MNQLQTTWGWLVAMYLFLGGLGAGAAIVTHILALAGRGRLPRTIRFGTWFGAIALAVGSAVLLIDVGKPFRAINLFRSFVHWDSWMMRGAWLLLAAMLVNGLSALFWTPWSMKLLDRLGKAFDQGRPVWRVVLAVLAIGLNLGVAIYTGLLLGALDFRPLWHTPLLPVLFTVSALDTGIGLVCGFATLSEKESDTAGIHRILEASVVLLILVEGTVLGFFVREMAQGTPDAIRSIELWLRGILWPHFWIGVVGFGLAVPFLVAISQLVGLGHRSGKWARKIPVVVGAMSCLIGGWLLRFVVLSAGLPVRLTSPDLFQALAGIKFIP